MQALVIMALALLAVMQVRTGEFLNCLQPMGACVEMLEGFMAMAMQLAHHSRDFAAGAVIHSACCEELCC